ncbi:MAG TPA: helix-turn-helix transcriptional regulator [Methylomirabilota bacterium]|nr:helix-turn-helix transcriptional regulator [Methylomirabilota bacterium]
MPTFGQAIAEARKRAGMTQKELAARLKKEDGSPISPQYLNDIEHDRRGAPPSPLLKQLSKILELDLNLLAYLAGRIPEDLLDPRASPGQVVEAFKAFRKKIGKGG